MRATFWSTGSLVGLALLSCQPIVIGNPHEQAGAASVDGSGGNASAGSDANGGTSSGGVSGTAGTKHGGSSGAASEAGETGAAGDFGNGGEAGASVMSPCVAGALTLQGHIATARGAAISGVSVALSGDASAMTTTDANGDYAFPELCAGHYQIAPLCTANSVNITLKSDARRDFVGIIGACDPLALQAKVLIIVYDPTMPEVGGGTPLLSQKLGADPAELALSGFDLLLAATNGHVRLKPANTLTWMGFPLQLGNFRYTADTYTACLNDAQQCHEGEADLDAVNANVGICSAVQDTGAEQIWLLGGDHFGFAPSRPFVCRLLIDGNVVEKPIDVIGMSYAAGLSGLLAGFQAHSDAVLKETVQSSPAFPPEGSGDNPYGAWFSALPAAPWLDEKAKLNDVWRYILRPDARLPLQSVTTTCSSSYQPGWCAHVSDLVHGECNAGEWATASQPKGWVEFLYNPPTIVSGVALYDRACEEQVTSGHLEFSDGSDDVPFGALEPTGTDFRSVTFKPRLVSGMRVVIDSSASTQPSYNPGFGEITVTKSN